MREGNGRKRNTVDEKWNGVLSLDKPRLSSYLGNCLGADYESVMS